MLSTQNVSAVVDAKTNVDPVSLRVEYATSA